MREALRKRMLYDWIAEHYSELTKYELKEIILNLDWVATEGMTDAEKSRFYHQIEEELENRDFW